MSTVHPGAATDRSRPGWRYGDDEPGYVPGKSTRHVGDLPEDFHGRVSLPVDRTDAAVVLGSLALLVLIPLVLLRTWGVAAMLLGGSAQILATFYLDVGITRLRRLIGRRGRSVSERSGAPTGIGDRR